MNSNFIKIFNFKFFKILEFLKNFKINTAFCARGLAVRPIRTVPICIPFIDHNRIIESNEGSFRLIQRELSLDTISKLIQREITSKSHRKKLNIEKALFLHQNLNQLVQYKFCTLRIGLPKFWNIGRSLVDSLKQKEFLEKMKEILEISCKHLKRAIKAIKKQPEARV